MRLMRFNIKDVRHVSGKLLYTADTLSRKIAQRRIPLPTIDENEMNAHVASVMEALPASDPKLKEIQQAQEKDEICQQIKKYCLDKWPDKHQVSNAIKPYWSIRGELTIIQNILLKGKQLVIPTSLQSQTLNRIHEGHLGINKCGERAKISVWWPGLSTKIKQMVENCKICSKYRQQQPEPLIPTPLPTRPWQLIGSNLSVLERSNYLLVVDYYSRYIEVVRMPKSTSSLAIIQALKTIIRTYSTTQTLDQNIGKRQAILVNMPNNTWTFHIFILPPNELCPP